MKSVFLLQVFVLACFVPLSQVTAKVRLMLARLARFRDKKKLTSFPLSLTVKVSFNLIKLHFKVLLIRPETSHCNTEL